MYKRIFIGATVLMILLSACSSHQKSSTDGEQVIKIGYLPITHAAPLFLDVYKGTGLAEKQYKLELVKFSSWPDLIDALNTGQIDGASVLMQLAMQAKEIGVDLTAVALGHEDGNVVISSDGIEQVSDLKGTSIAIPHTHSSHHLLVNEMLTRKGMNIGDIDLIELPPPEMPAALAEKRISGYIVAEPFGALAVQLGIGKVFAPSSDIWPNLPCCVLVFRNGFIEKNDMLTYQFVEDYVEAGRLVDEKSNDFYDAFQEHMNVDDDVLDLSFEWITFHSLQIEKDAYEKLVDRILQLNLMDSPPSYEDFVDRRFIEAVRLK